MKRQMLSNYQLKIADLYDIPTNNVKRLVPNVCDKEKYVFHCEKLQLYLRLELKLKKIYCVLEFIQSHLAKTVYQKDMFNTHKKKNRSRKKWRQRWKSVVQINEQCGIRQNNGGLEKKNRSETCKQQKNYLKWRSKLSYMS